MVMVAVIPATRDSEGLSIDRLKFGFVWAEA